MLARLLVAQGNGWGMISDFPALSVWTGERRALVREVVGVGK